MFGGTLNLAVSIYLFNVSAAMLSTIEEMESIAKLYGGSNFQNCSAEKSHDDASCRFN